MMRVVRGELAHTCQHRGVISADFVVDGVVWTAAGRRMARSW